MKEREEKTTSGREKQKGGGGKTKGKKYPKIKLLFRIISLAYKKRKKIKDIIDELGISRPSFYRYLKEIEKSGFFLVRNYKNGEIEISFKKDLFESGDEADKLLLALGYESVGKVIRFPYGEEGVYKRTKASMKYQSIKKFLDEARIIMFEEAWFKGEVNITVLDHISNAMKNKKGIKFIYEKKTGEEGEYIVFPLAIFSRDGDWYLWAYDIDRGKRIFKLSRIKDIKSKDISASNFPPDVVSQSWRSVKLELYKKMRLAWKFYYPEDGRKSEEVKFEVLSPEVLQIFKERKFHRSQKIIEEGGKAFVVFRVGEPKEMIKDLASFGPNIKIISPPSLVSEFKKYLKDTLKLYKGS